MANEEESSSSLLFFEDRRGKNKTPAFPPFNNTSLTNTTELPITPTPTSSSDLLNHVKKENQISTKPSSHSKGKWHDEDDDQVIVDLMQFDRLKKLRKEESEQFISGTEYAKRLTSLSAFQKYHPTHTPSWAIPPSLKRDTLEAKEKEKKRKNKKQKNTNKNVNANDPEVDSDLDNIPLPISSSLHKSSEENLESGDELENEHDHHDESENEINDQEWMGEENPDLGSLLRSTAPLVELPTRHLSSEFLHLSRLPNVQHVHGSVVSDLQFHPNCNLLFSTGPDKTLRLAHVNGRDNPTLTQLRFNDLPLFSCCVHPSGDHVILTGKRTYWYSYHLTTGLVSRLAAFHHREDILPSLEKVAWSPSGKYLGFLGASGHVVIVDGHSKKWITQFKMNGEARSMAWVRDTLLTCVTKEGQVYVFDLTLRRCVSTWHDQETYKPNAVAVAQPSLHWMATGSYSGIVNVYRSTSSTSAVPSWELHRPLGQLTTPITGVRFNADAQIMAMWSRSKKDQLKLVHLPSGHVFHNWPTQRTPLAYVQTMQFSPHSGIMAIGNDKGRILLYKLKHYQHY